MLKIYLTNLAKYNAGELVGEWVDMEESGAWEEALDRVCPDQNTEEWFITDYETDFNYHIDEFDDLEELAEIGEQTGEMDDEEREILGAAVDVIGGPIEDLIEMIQDKDYFVYPDCYDMGDVAYRYMEESGELDQIPERYQGYFDFDALGRDMDIEGTFAEINCGMVEFIR